MSVAEAGQSVGSRVLANSTVAGSAAALPLAGAAIHLWVLPAHAQAWWVFGTFFALAALAQLLTVVIVLRWPEPPLILAALATQVGIILVWMISRTSGLPIGPPVVDMTAGLADPNRGGYGPHTPGYPEPVGLLDTASTVIELLTVCALLAMLSEATRRRTINLLLIGGLLLWGSYLISTVIQ